MTASASSAADRAMAATSGRTCTVRGQWSGSRSARRSACQARPRPNWTGARGRAPRSVPSRGGWKAVRRFLAVTPVVGAPQLGPAVSVKVETVQPTGSFKVRGGLAAVSATLEQDPGRAVVASSAGNHGLGLAYAASKLGAAVTVVVPTGASAAKVSALQQFDVRLELHGEGYREAETYALEPAARDGSRYVSPYNDPDVIAGQAWPGSSSSRSRPGHRGRALRRRRVAGRRHPRSRGDGRARRRDRVRGVTVHEHGADGPGASCPSRSSRPWPTGWRATSSRVRSRWRRARPRRRRPHRQRGRHPLRHGLLGFQDGSRPRGCRRGRRRRLRAAW